MHSAHQSNYCVTPISANPVMVGGRKAHAPEQLANGSRRFVALRDYAGRGVITTAKYETRAPGVHSGTGLMKAAAPAWRPVAQQTRCVKTALGDEVQLTTVQRFRLVNRCVDPLNNVLRKWPTHLPVRNLQGPARRRKFRCAAPYDQRPLARPPSGKPPSPRKPLPPHDHPEHDEKPPPQPHGMRLSPDGAAPGIVARSTSAIGAGTTRMRKSEVSVSSDRPQPRIAALSVSPPLQH